MIKEGKFGVHETVCLIVIALSSKVLFSYTSILLGFAANSAWLMTLVSGVSAAVLFTFIYLLLKRFPGKNLMEIYDLSLGRIIGFIFSISLAIAILFCSGILVREFTDIIKAYVFPYTPSSFISAALLLPVVVAAYLGLESIARFAKIAAWFTLIGFLLGVALSSPYFQTANIFPIMGYGLDVNIMQGFIRTCTYSEVIFIAIFAGALQGIKQIKKAGYISLIISVLIISAGILISVLVMSYPLAQEQMSPLYAVTRQIALGEFFQRMDPLFLFVWITATIVTVSIEFYCGISVYCKAFRLQDRKPLIIPVAIIVYAVSFIPRDFTAVEDALIFIRTYGIFVVFLMPFIALVVSLLRRKKGERAA